MKISTKLILATALLSLLLGAEAWLNYRHSIIVRETAARVREIFAPVLGSSRSLTLDLANLHTALAEPDARVRERAGNIVLGEFQTRLERTRHLLEAATHQPLEPRFAGAVRSLLRDTRHVEHALTDFAQAWGPYVLLSVSDPAGAAGHAQKSLRPILNEEVGPALTRLVTATNRQIEADVSALETDTARDTRVRLTFTFGFFGIVAALAWSLHRSALAPLRHLVVAAQSVSQGNRRLRLDSSQPDELGTVARAFNAMLDTLHATSVSRTELEAVVATRTAELRESQAHLARAMEGSQHGYWDWDLTTNRVDFSPRWVTMLGYAAGELDPRFTTWETLVHPEDKLPTLRALRDHAEGRRPDCEIEHRLRTKDGAWRWMLARGRIVSRDPDGRARHLSGTQTDITARKEAEAATRRQKEFLEALHRTTLDLLEEREMDQLLQSIIERSTSILDAPLGQLLLAEDEALVIRAFTANQPALHERRITRGRALISWQAFDTHEPVVIPDYEAFAGPKESYRPGPVRAVAEFPILRGERCLGVLALARSDSHSPFTEEEIERGRMLARQAALVVHNASIYTDAVRRAAAGVAALRESEEKFRGVFDQSPVIIVLLSYPEGRIVELNAAGLAAFGYDRDEVLHRTTGEIGIWADPAERAQYLATILARGHVTGSEARMRRKHGEAFTVLYSGSLLTIGGQRYSLNSLQDITDRKRAEEALRLAQTRLIAAQRIARLGSWEWEAGSNRTVWSEENYRIFGVEPATFTPSFHRFLLLIAPADRARMEQTLTSALTRRQSYSADYEIVRPDGLRRHLHDEAEPIFAADGTLIGFHGTSQDVTAQVQAETERQHMEVQLRQAQKLESLGTLAGGIAHDFNNILTGMLGFVELVRLDLPSDHGARPWLDGISASGNRAKDLVRQILTFSRRDESTRLATKLGPVVTEAVQLLRSTLPPMVRLETVIEPNCPPVLGDSTQLHQVLMNLCTNAWHALPAAGGCITIELASLPALPPAQAAKPDARPGPSVRLTVRDNGSGMDAATLERIFEPFFTTKAPGQGTGLGLAVTHGIVQSHDGQINVRSTPGVGTLFEIFLPTLTAPPGPAPAPALATLPSGHGEHLLYVDDDTVGAAALTQLFQRLGYRVTCATNARAALDHYAGQPGTFDLVLTDYAMPGMTGLELAETLLQRDPSLPVILLSGLIEPPQREHLLALGVKAVLLKPPALRELAEAVAHVFADRPPADQ